MPRERLRPHTHTFGHQPGDRQDGPQHVGRQRNRHPHLERPPALRAHRRRWVAVECLAMLMGLFREYGMLGTFKLELAVHLLMNFLGKNTDLAKMLAADKNITILTEDNTALNTPGDSLPNSCARTSWYASEEYVFMCVYVCFMLCRGCRTGLYSFQCHRPSHAAGCIPEGGHLPDRAGRAQPRHQSGEQLHPEWSIQYAFSYKRFWRLG